MMHDMMGGTGWGMGLIGLLAIVLLVLAIAALIPGAAPRASDALQTLDHGNFIR